MSLPEPSVSIIVTCWDQVEYTRECIASVLRYTPPPFEMVLVDNGSTDATPEFFRTLAEQMPGQVRVITNPANRGYPAGCNQGLAVARGKVLVLANNDLVLTTDWLDQGLALVNSAPDIDMVGPMSNYASPPQLVERPGYRNLDEMHGFAAAWRSQHRGRWMEVEKLSGFLLFMKRAVYEATGGLCEDYGLGMFDDDHKSRECRSAGFRLAVAKDCFIHHSGSRSFIGGKIDTEALLRENQAKFAAHFGADAIRGQVRVAMTPWTAPPTGRRAKTSLVMIVKNEVANLAACLDSVRGLFDEIVIIDTGSTDTTKEIARAYGARVCDASWTDDFAQARNAGLFRATGDYVFWMDADDRLDPSQLERLRALLASLTADGTTAYVLRCACVPDHNGGGQTVVDHVRLFPRLEGQARWEGRVHEQILGSLQRAGVKMVWSDVVITHTGYTDPDLRKRKFARDEAILREEIQERPGHAFPMFNLGNILMERGDWSGALALFKASLAASAPSDSIVNKLYVLASRCHQVLGRPELALAA
jgi:glycosyltransferase involved in cell wall biosynthesis